MKPLWNAPSLGTIGAAGALVVTTATVIYSPLIWITLLILAPAVPVVQSAWFKRPLIVWRAAVVASMIWAWMLLRLPIFDYEAIPTLLTFPEVDNIDLQVMLHLTGPYVMVALLIEFALLPLLLAAVLHTKRPRSWEKKGEG